MYVLINLCKMQCPLNLVWENLGLSDHVIKSYAYMSKHVEDVKGRNNLQHALIYIGFDGMVGKPQVSTF